MSAIKKHIHGEELGLTFEGALAANGVNITRPAVDAVITVGTDNTGTHTRTIAVQLNTANGLPLVAAEMVEIFVMSDTTGDFAVTGGSTGLADAGPAATNGALLAVIAKKYFKAITTAAGLLNLTFVDTAGETCFLAVRLPNGRLIYSASILTT